LSAIGYKYRSKEGGGAERRHPLWAFMGDSHNYWGVAQNHF